MNKSEYKKKLPTIEEKIYVQVPSKDFIFDYRRDNTVNCFKLLNKTNLNGKTIYTFIKDTDIYDNSVVLSGLYEMIQKGYPEFYKYRMEVVNFSDISTSIDTGSNNTDFVPISNLKMPYKSLCEVSYVICDSKERFEEALISSRFDIMTVEDDYHNNRDVLEYRKAYPTKPSYLINQPSDVIAFFLGTKEFIPAKYTDKQLTKRKSKY